VPSPLSAHCSRFPQRQSNPAALVACASSALRLLQSLNPPSGPFAALRQIPALLLSRCHRLGCAGTTPSVAKRTRSLPIQGGDIVVNWPSLSLRLATSRSLPSPLAGPAVLSPSSQKGTDCRPVTLPKAPPSPRRPSPGHRNPRRTASVLCSQASPLHPARIPRASFPALLCLCFRS
jgi:hypothetical protein